MAGVGKSHECKAGVVRREEIKGEDLRNIAKKKIQRLVERLRRTAKDFTRIPL